MPSFKQSCAAVLVAVSLTLGACGDDAKETVVPSITAPASIGNGVVGAVFAPTSIAATGTTPITFAVTRERCRRESLWMRMGSTQARRQPPVSSISR